MQLKEEQEFKKIISDYEKAIQFYRESKFAQAEKIFKEIISSYSSSEFFSVLEVVGKVKDYLALCKLKLNPPEIELNSDEEILMEAIYQINAGNFDKGLAFLSKIKNENGEVLFYQALALIKKDQTSEALKKIEKCIQTDESYKNVIYNEPDFYTLHENGQFKALIE